MVRSRSWAGTQTFYSDLIFKHGWKQQPMLDLVQHIIKSDLDKKLYHFTKLHMLILSIYENIELGKETLSIEYQPVHDEWLFTYQALPFQPPQFTRKYNGESAGIIKLDAFIKLINW